MQLKTETKVGLFVFVAIVLFAYMATYLGVFRLYKNNYNSYLLYVDDLSGLEKKADVKISGVKVGWVDEVHLVDNGVKARIVAAVLQNYIIYSDAKAQIKQDGILGNKYLEIYPGSNKSSQIPSGESLRHAVMPLPSIENLIKKFDSIATNIEDVSASLRNVIATPSQQGQLKAIVDNINQVSSRVAVFSDMLARNENNFDALISNLRQFSDNILPLAGQLNNVSDKLYSDFNRVANGLENTLENIHSVIRKIDQGQGLLGKLVNETDVYDDIKVIAQGLSSYATFADNVGVVMDTHFEAMCRPAEHYKHEDSKGYFDFRLHTSEDLFYMLQVMGSQKGSITRVKEHNTYFGPDGRPLDMCDISKYPSQFWFSPFETEKYMITRNTYRIGLQIGKMYKDLCFRFGLFEGYVGAGVDYELPSLNENLRWVTSFEMYDLRGQDRINDRRPHLKWINKVYFLRNLYCNFGADDFISKKNSNAFFGFGLRFSDDDLKYLLAKVGGLGGFVNNAPE